MDFEFKFRLKLQDQEKVEQIFFNESASYGHTYQIILRTHTSLTFVAIESIFKEFELKNIGQSNLKNWNKQFTQNPIFTLEKPYSFNSINISNNEETIHGEL